MQHGGDLTEAMARHGGTLGDWLDLSTGINPHAYPLPVFAPALATRLPSKGDLERLLAAARRAYGVAAGAEIVAAAGTSTLIAALPRLVPAGPVAIFGPTYGEHALAWRGAGCEVLELPWDAGCPPSAQHAVLVHPNNPDGGLVDSERLSRVAETIAQRGGTVIVDESFVDVAPGLSHAGLVERWPIVALRSFGKFYGLAGVRLGFAIAAPALARRIAAALGPWAVSGWAIATGTAALADDAWAATMRERLAREATALDDVLTRAGLAVIGGTSLYRLARIGRAHDLQDALAARRVLVRRFDWADDLLRFGLPGSPAGLDRLAAALAHG